MKLLGNRVLLEKPKGGIRTTKGGILLSEDAYYDRGMKCKIVDCGNSKILADCWGWLAVISHLVGIEIEIDGEKYIIARDRDVQAIIEGE